MELVGPKTVVTAAMLLVLGQLLGTGLQQYGKGEFEQAAGQFTQIIDRYPVNPYTDDAYYWRGDCYLKLGRKDAARKDLMTVLGKFPDSEYAGLAEAALAREFGQDEAVAGGLKKRVDELVAALADREFVVREEATKRLIDIGELAVPRVKEAAAGEDPEVKMRAERVLTEIEEKRLLAQLDSPGTYVTLKATDVPLSKVLQEIEEQTGNTFDLTRERSSFNDRPVSCEFTKTPFWQAMRELCVSSQIYVSGNDGGGGMRIYSGRSGQESWPTTVAGPLMIAVNQLNNSYNFQDKQSYLNLSGTMWVEPRLRCIGYYYPQITRVLDDVGSDVEVQQQGSGMNTIGDGMQGGWSVSLKNVNREARHLNLVEGSVMLLLPLVFDELAVPDVTNAKEVSAAKGQYAMKVTQVTRENNRLMVQLNVDRTFAPGEQQRYDSYRQKDFCLVDEKGTEIASSGVNHMSGNSDNTRYTWGGAVYFTPPPEGKLSFRFRFPSRVISKSVEFRLENVPLP